MVLSFLGSGRSQSQIATISIVKSVNTLTASGALVNNIRTALIDIMIVAIHLAFRGTVPWSRQSLSVAPYLGWFNNRSYILGQPFEDAQSARIKKTVVGIPGSAAPIIPSAIKIMTKLRQKRMRIPIYSFNSVFTKSIIRSIKSFAVEIYSVDSNKDF